jgi:predicted CopG family antitoxin
MGKINIEVHEETWKMLNRRKEPGQTFDEVIQELGAQVEA